DRTEVAMTVLSRRAAVPEGAGDVREAAGGATQLRPLSALPAEERPRERLRRHGASALSSRELLALLLGTGTRRASALDVAAALRASGLRGLPSLTLGELESAHGLGRAKASRIVAALELGSRLAAQVPEGAPFFRSPAESAQYLLPRYS